MSIFRYSPRPRRGEYRPNDALYGDKIIMKKRSKPVFGGAENIAAMVYLCSISAVVMHLICRDYAVVCTAIMTALCCGVYMLFYVFRNRRLVSLGIFFALMAACMLVVSSVNAAMGSLALIEFIYNASDYFNVTLAAASITLFSFVVTYPVFYFMVRLPRPCFLLLPALAPLILGARTVSFLPGGLIAFLSAGYFVAVMGMSHAEYPSENRYVDDPKARRERLAVMGIFGSAAAALIMLIPRSTETPYVRYLDARMFYNSIYGTQSLTGFSQSSSINTGNNNVSENVLFYVITNNPQNIISQSFDKYRGRDGWTYLSEYSLGYRDWWREQRALNYSQLAYTLKKAASEGKLEDYADGLLALPELSRGGISSMTIQIADNSNTTVIRHPAGTFNVWISGKNETIYRNAKDEMFTDTPFGANAAYTMSFYGTPPEPAAARHLSGLSQEEYLGLLDAAKEEGVIDEDAHLAFKNAYISALNYLIDTTDEAVTPRIQALADEITAGLDNDYDKALAIEEWFGKDGFVYDLDFVPQELSAEYFLFTSKRGICTDFATASTLLLRAAGVSARYTEGFALKTDIDHIDLYGRLEVKADQAHAFASAYIPGSGWLDVDGTKYAALASQGKELQRMIFFAAAAAGVLVLLCVIFRKRIAEAAFAVRFKLGHGAKRIRALYLRLRRTACSITGADPKTTTSGEVLDVISRTLLLGKEAGEITSAADALLYGGSKEKIDAKRLYRNYKLIRKARRSRGKG